MSNEETIRERIADAVRETKETAPLTGSITNYVTVDFVANAQLAAGGSAAMVYLPDEGTALAETSSAFYINVGTLLPSHEETVCVTATMLHELGRPWVLDPVGIGLGASRSRMLDHMRVCKPSVIRCNASEAIALARAWGLDAFDGAGAVKGVDSTESVHAARAAAVSLARHTKGAVAVSGACDLITDGALVAFSKGGSKLMGKVTGFGCALGGVAACYAACGDPFTAALAASNAFNQAASRAACIADAPASFKVSFLDALYKLSPEDVASNPFNLEEA